MIMRVLACLMLAVWVLPVRGGNDEADYDGSVLVYPEQYFGCEWKDSYCDGLAPDYWSMLFPGHPPFRYACIYLGSFDHEFGFYLDGDKLYWARAIAPQSMQMLGQKPIVRLQEPYERQGKMMLAGLPCPVLERVAAIWPASPGKDEKDDNPFAPSEHDEVPESAPLCREMVDKAACLMEEGVNVWMYRFLYVRRGCVTLKPAVADTLRRTWDEAVTRRTFVMDEYRQLMQGLDGNYCYFRGASGLVAEDLCSHSKDMRAAMMDLSYGLIDMAMMGDWSPETEKWLMSQCANVRKKAEAVGDAPPPMVSKKWVDVFVKRYFDRLDRENRQREEKVENKGGCGDSFASDKNVAAEEPKTEEKAVSPSDEEERYVRGFRERFLKPLDGNVLWNDLFPRGAWGKPGVCWFGSRGVSGLYMDGDVMVRAVSSMETPFNSYGNWFFNHIPEKRFFPYEGLSEPCGEYGPRVKREWLAIGPELNRLFGNILTGVARGRMAAERGEKNKRGSDVSFCIVRGMDGTERVLFAADDDIRAVVELMDLLYEVDLLFGVEENYLKYVEEKCGALRGKPVLE